MMIICRLKERYKGREKLLQGRKGAYSAWLNSALAVQKREVARWPQPLGTDNSN